nr:isochorismatase family protein [Streptococcus merionis]
MALEVSDVIIDKRYNSAFKATKLQNYLDGTGIEHLNIIGVTINVVVKVAFKLGDQAAVVEQESFS